jgi:hypothetical protein
VWSSPLSYARPVDDHWSLDPAVNPTYSSWTRTVAAATLRSKAFPSLASVARVAVTSIDSGVAARAVTAWSPTGTSASVSGNVLRTALGLPSAWVYRVTSTLATQPAVAAVDAFVTPGYHVVSGREWLTSCASYGSASGKRCWAWIKATKTSWTGTSYVTHYGWVLDMLTYVDRVSPSWATNPLARPGPFTSAGRAWTTACWPGGVTSPRTCRTWIWAVVATRTATASGGYTYSRRWAWVVNNQVRLTAA